MKRRIVFIHIALVCLVILSNSVNTSAFNFQDIDVEAEKKRAILLIEQNKHYDALPILEKLEKVKPDDLLVLEKLAVSLLSVCLTSKTESRESINSKLARAREISLKSKKLGNDSQLINLILETIPEDVTKFVLAREEANISPAQKALNEAENAFAQGNMDEAIKHYELAGQLDPKLYEAPLYLGDVYFKQKNLEKAYASYQKAITIDPDRETAYRYWGSVLMKNGKLPEAKDKFIDAIIADPYNNQPWGFLIEWSKQSKITLSHPSLDVPKDSVKRGSDNQTNITLDVSALMNDKKDGKGAWTFYSISRGASMTDELWKKDLPKEKEYRHSLKAEADAITMVATMVTTDLGKGELKENNLDVTIKNLLKLHKAGLIEAYVLFAMPDNDIAKDYVEYRKNNRKKLRQYLVEFVTAGN